MIEDGSNADGEYVCFADGTQICWFELSAININFAAGAIFRSNGMATPFPVAFVSPPAASGEVISDSNSFANVRAYSSSACIISAFRYVAATGVTVRAGAIGRWY